MNGRNPDVTRTGAWRVENWKQPMANKRSGRRRKAILLGGMALVLAAMAAVAVLRKREAVIRVEVERVERRDLIERVVANGRIQPMLQVKISAEVSGEIIELPVKEGQTVQKGDLLARIKPDVYLAARRSAEASYQSAVSGRALAEAQLRKADEEFNRQDELFRAGLVSGSVQLEFRTGLDVARAQWDSASHQVEVARASLARAEEELAKTQIDSPVSGTVSQLNSELGERVVGTAMMTGTEIMTIADLERMEARVDIGEIDIPLVALEQRAVLEVDAFRDRQFEGRVWEIANSAKGAPGGGQSQEGTKFEVRIRVLDREAFRPGMTVTAEIETRYRTNVLTVPIQAVTTRPPKTPAKTADEPADGRAAEGDAAGSTTNAPDATTPVASRRTTGKRDSKPKHDEVVFVVEEGRAKQVTVTRGISDDNHTEIETGLTEGQEIVTGGYKAIAKDLEDGRKIERAPAAKKPGVS
jgi:HlyD family secretion protein